MKHKDLDLDDFVKRLNRAGWAVELAGGRAKITKTGSPIGQQIHLHKGKNDLVRRHAVKDTLRKLGISPEEFYSPL